MPLEPKYYKFCTKCNRTHDSHSDTFRQHKDFLEAEKLKHPHAGKIIGGK